MGSATRSSQRAKAPTISTAMANATNVGAESHPCTGASMMAYISVPRPATDKSAPMGSGAGLRWSIDDGTRKAPASSATATTPTLVRKIEPHQKCCSSHPLVTPPSAAPTPAKPAQMATARWRSSGGNTWASTERVAGMTRAAPRPITALAATSWPAEPAKAASPEATPKTTRPPFSASLRP